jgi:hypothetical protein
MVAGATLTPDDALHTGSLKEISGSRTQVVDPQARVSLPSVPQVRGPDQ